MKADFLYILEADGSVTDLRVHVRGELGCDAI